MNTTMLRSGKCWVFWTLIQTDSHALCLFLNQSPPMCVCMFVCVCVYVWLELLFETQGINQPPDNWYMIHAGSDLKVSFLCWASMVMESSMQPAKWEKLINSVTQLQHLWSMIIISMARYEWCSKWHSHVGGNQWLSNWTKVCSIIGKLCLMLDA